MSLSVLRRCAAAALVAGVSSCTFNVEDTTQTLSWSRDLAGVQSVALDQRAFGGCGVGVRGAAAESLTLTCDLRRLVTEGSEPPEDVQLQVSREDDSVTLTLATSGEDWVTIAVDSVWMRLGRWFELNVGEVEGGIRVRDYGAFVTGSSAEAGIEVETEVGADLVTNDGDIDVTVSSDSVFWGVVAESRNGDITVRVPGSLRATIELSTRSGDIRVMGRSIGESDYSVVLNGGQSAGTIRCETAGGDIVVDTLPGT